LGAVFPEEYNENDSRNQKWNPKPKGEKKQEKISRMSSSENRSVFLFVLCRIKDRSEIRALNKDHQYEKPSKTCRRHSQTDFERHGLDCTLI
jgi:hypothetical protein